MNTLLAVVLIVVMGAPQKTADRATQEFNVPEEVQDVFSKPALSSNYEVSFQINPFYLRGDFNGDGRADLAVLMKHRRTKKSCVAIVHMPSRRVFVLGVGGDTTVGGDDFEWMDYWYVYPKGPVGLGVGERTIPRLRGEALLVGKSETASGLIYWNGRKYLWYQQGD